MLKARGPGALMAKVDIESAFRLQLVYPDDFCQLVFQFEGGLYLDKALPMGPANSCKNFEGFSCFLEWAIKTKAGSHFVAHYLDDFLFLGPTGSGSCARLLAQFEEQCGELGVPLARGKTEGLPSPLTFLGVELDSVQQCSRLPKDKPVNLRALIV